RRACGRIDVEELRRLQTELERLTAAPARSAARFVAKARDIDSRLHDLIAGSGGNEFLAKELNRLKILFRAFRDMAWEYEGRRNDFQRLAEEAREHLAIVEALLAGDRRAAMRAMSRHVLSGIKYWSRALPDGTKTETNNGTEAKRENDHAANGRTRRSRGNGGRAAKQHKRSSRSGKHGSSADANNGR
ncbi:MAG: FCD domain-containing protein, partial [Planctomycetaceae bacterium]